MSDSFDLQYELSRAIEYRTGVLERFPHDARNVRAIEILTDLSGQSHSAEMYDGLVAAVDEYELALEGFFDDHEASAVVFFEGAPPIETRVSDTLGSIGFRFHPNTIDEVIVSLTADVRLALADLMQARAAVTAAA